MPIHQAEHDFFTQSAQNSKLSKPLSQVTLAESRASIASTFWLMNQKKSSIPYIEKKAIMRDQQQIDFTIYNHHLPVETKTIFYIMGNGYIYDLYKLNAAICLRMAEKIPLKIIIANARLAPEHPLPIPIYDQFDSLNNILSQSDALNIQGDSVILIGYCTGASCAVAITQLLLAEKKFNISQLILLNGIYDLTHSNQHYLEYENADVSMSRELLNYIYNQQNLTPNDKYNPLYSPVFYSHFDNFPKTSLIVAEYDRNRSSSEYFYQTLKRHKVPAKKVILEGQTHNTIIFHDKIPGSKDPVDSIIQEII